MSAIWDLLKVGLLVFFGIFYSLLFIIFAVRIFRALANPIDEIELIDQINRNNSQETLIEWKERES
ncbi:MAG: hypothetical protein EBV07_00405 [Proteobacteria bacterium]|nr:hypothetical protein [Pseudomonadota bacterium]